MNSLKRILYLIISCIFFSYGNLMYEYHSYYEKLFYIVSMSLINLLIIFSMSILLYRRTIFSNDTSKHKTEISPKEFDLAVGISLIHFIQIPLFILMNHNYKNINHEIIQSASIIIIIIIFICSYYDFIKFSFLNILFKYDNRGEINLDTLEGDKYYNNFFNINEQQKPLIEKIRINSEFRNSVYLRKNRIIDVINNSKDTINELVIGLAKKNIFGFENNSGRILVKLDDKTIIDKSPKSIKSGWNDYTISLKSGHFKKISAISNDNNSIYLNMPYINSKVNHNKNIIILCLDGLRKDMLGL